ncbi:MAG: class I SAM-dependent methyltransferase [Silvibacterium sp.]|nr:class I SAM-dependent methyltransferase [Silvibacterium sp.]
MPTARPWKARLYDAYVSSGQARQQGESINPEKLFSPRKAYLNHLIRNHLPQTRDSSILDLGCGHGAFLYFLSRAGYTNIAGVDTSPEQIELAHRLGIQQAELGGVADYLGRRHDSSCDAVLLMDIIEHLGAQELFDLLDSVYRVLVPDGVCLVHAPNAEGLYGMRVRYGDFTHETAFTPNSASQIFRTVGFRSVEAFEDKPVIHGVKSIFRRALWHSLTLYDRLLLLAETGSGGAILSQNFVVRATK